jgi:hypothetical protein
MSDVLKCCYQEYVLDPHEPVAENLWLTVTDVAATLETDTHVSSRYHTRSITSFTGEKLRLALSRKTIIQQI